VAESGLGPGTRRSVLRRAATPLVAFAGVALGGIAGFAALGGVGLVEATFWLVDLTSVELHFQEHAGPETLAKAFAVAVRVGLVVTGLWIGESVLTAAFGGQIRGELRRVQNQRAIDDLSGHVVVCGYGMFGRTIATGLAAAGRDVVVVERDDAEHRRVLDDDLPGVQGDARREDVLVRAGVGRARTLVAAIDDSNANIQIALVASGISTDLDVVVRIGDEMYEEVARRAGADHVTIPEVASGQRVLDLL
jgi:voltage-gated potassium channel